MNLLLDHCFGKPIERVQEDKRVFILDGTKPDSIDKDDTDSQVVDGEVITYSLTGDSKSDDKT